MHMGKPYGEKRGKWPHQKTTDKGIPDSPTKYVGEKVTKTGKMSGDMMTVRRGTERMHKAHKRAEADKAKRMGY